MNVPSLVGCRRGETATSSGKARSHSVDSVGEEADVEDDGMELVITEPDDAATQRSGSLKCQC